MAVGGGIGVAAPLAQATTRRAMSIKMAKEILLRSLALPDMVLS